MRMPYKNPCVAHNMQFLCLSVCTQFHIRSTSVRDRDKEREKERVGERGEKAEIACSLLYMLNNI